jgi:hypothetical protein
MGLKKLDLRGCRALKTLPDSLGKLTGLTQLNLEECRALTTVPESVGNLKVLTELELGGCRVLTALPDSLGKLTGLIRLSLRKCESLEALPDSLGALTRLTELDIEACGALAGPLPGSLRALVMYDLVLMRKVESMRQHLPLDSSDLLDSSDFGPIRSVRHQDSTRKGMLATCGSALCCILTRSFV